MRFPVTALAAFAILLALPTPSSYGGGVVTFVPTERKRTYFQLMQEEVMRREMIRQSQQAREEQQAREAAARRPTVPRFVRPDPPRMPVDVRPQRDPPISRRQNIVVIDSPEAQRRLGLARKEEEPPQVAAENDEAAADAEKGQEQSTTDKQPIRRRQGALAMLEEAIEEAENTTTAEDDTETQEAP
jgi:hypothetical protein